MATFENIPKATPKSSKSRTQYEEADLEREINFKMREDAKVRELEIRLENLKTANMGHRELQQERNRITAQLSRDRKKIETDYLKQRCIELSRLVQQY